MGKLLKRSLKKCVVIYLLVYNHVENLRNSDEGQAKLPDMIKQKITAQSHSCIFFKTKNGEITEAVSEGVCGHLSSITTLRTSDFFFFFAADLKRTDIGIYASIVSFPQTRNLSSFFTLYFCRVCDKEFCAFFQILVSHMMEKKKKLKNKIHFCQLFKKLKLKKTYQGHALPVQPEPLSILPHRPCIYPCT